MFEPASDIRYVSEIDAISSAGEPGTVVSISRPSVRKLDILVRAEVLVLLQRHRLIQSLLLLHIFGQYGPLHEPLSPPSQRSRLMVFAIEVCESCSEAEGVNRTLPTTPRP
jgi:hypothetical protein